jgi:hypothetical protein
MKNRVVNAFITFLVISIWFYVASIILPSHPLFIAGSIFFIPAFTLMGWFKGFPIIVKRFPVTKTSEE